MDIARQAAAAAAEYLRGVARPAPGSWEVKSPRDFVTAVDRTSEGIIRDLLLRAEPGSQVMGEELSPDAGSGGLTWVVDPLDGTTNFLHGFPAWAVSIGIALDGALVGGVVHDVPRGVVSHAVAGGGAWQGERRLAVSTVDDPALALIGTGFPFKEAEPADRYLGEFRRVMTATSGIRRPGAASLDLVSVAEGAFDGFWEIRLAPWDIAAGIVLVREAGGVVTDYAGRAVGAEHTGIVAGNPAIQRWLRQVVAG